MGRSEASSAKNFWWFPLTPSFRQMGFLGVSCTFVSVTLETCQPYIVACVSLGVIQPVDTKLLCIFGLVGPKEFYVSNCTAVIFGLP